jgi:hypothetical protein
VPGSGGGGREGISSAAGVEPALQKLKAELIKTADGNYWPGVLDNLQPGKESLRKLLSGSVRPGTRT